MMSVWRVVGFRVGEGHCERGGSLRSLNKHRDQTGGLMVGPIEGVVSV